MNMISWNVNGLRAVLQKKALDAVWALQPDVLCLQETKAQPEQIPEAERYPEGYHSFYHSAERKGYSGVAIYTRSEPAALIEGVGHAELDREGRTLTAEYDDFFLINCYVPNAQPELARIEARMAFNDALKDFMLRLEEKKPVILCGDLNVAHQAIDLKHPKANERNPGYSIEERMKFSELLQAGFVDIFRQMYPQRVAYTWWSFRMQARQKNVGWRIDYFVLSPRISPRVADVRIHDQIMGSDHCPVELELLD